MEEHEKKPIEATIEKTEILPLTNALLNQAGELACRPGKKIVLSIDENLLMAAGLTFLALYMQKQTFRYEREIEMREYLAKRRRLPHLW